MDELKRLLADIPDVPDNNVVAVEVWTGDGEVGASIPLGTLRRLVAIEAAAVQYGTGPRSAGRWTMPDPDLRAKVRALLDALPVSGSLRVSRCGPVTLASVVIDDETGRCSVSADRPMPWDAAVAALRAALDAPAPDVAALDAPAPAPEPVGAVKGCWHGPTCVECLSNEADPIAAAERESESISVRVAAAVSAERERCELLHAASGLPGWVDTDAPGIVTGGGCNTFPSWRDLERQLRRVCEHKIVVLQRAMECHDVIRDLPTVETKG